jgi:DNA-binding XRE family transcriptional regulator
MEEEKKFYLRIGENIKRSRETANLRQEEFAIMLGLSRASIVNIEKGRQSPSLYLIVKATHILKVSIEDLVGEVYNKNMTADSDLSDSVKRKIKLAEQELNDSPGGVDKLKNFILENTSI